MRIKLLFPVLWVAMLAFQSYAVSYSAENDKYQPLTNLPTIFIDTENGVEITSKEEYVNAVVTVRGAADDEVNITEVVAEIKGRGNSTWGMDKKPYRLKFDKKINFMGNEAKEKNWVLLANYADKTLMRNALAFETARNLFDFAFTPSVTFVDVVLNGKNIGSYLVTDQVEVKDKRVAIMEQETTVVQGDPEITGGYLIEVDGFASREVSWFKTSKGMQITIKYPKDDEINSSQKNYIANYTQRMENTLFSDRFDDEERGWRHYVDEASWVNWYIACELFGNSDSWWSTYMYKERDEKFKFGPLWDFDIAFNNDYRIGNATEKYMRESACEPKTWIKRWWQDETLHDLVKKRWQEMGAENIRTFMNNYIDATAALLEESQQNNYEIWPTLNKRVHYEYAVLGSYEAEVQNLKKYVNARIDFLEKAWGAPAGVDGKLEGMHQVVIAPNPVAKGSSVKIAGVHGAVDVAISLVDGKLVYSARKIASADNTISIDSNQFATGLYIVAVRDAEGNVYRSKLLIE
ncbi:MAG: CotH kinase family protein [Bacteroidales bacterium]|nr:CotH kinase family protein [Bacteroidales bacterium]